MKKLFLQILVLFLLVNINFQKALIAQPVPENFENPVLSGFHPDPSIIRVEDDYYMVNSSFEWYPGIPIHHSKDLVNWELIGYGITRPDQVELPEGLPDSRGIYAVTIRYKDGTFYLITTCVACNRNFYITSTDPAGPWSDPVWLDSPGIDPSLFWDEDGTCYYVGHGNITGAPYWPNKTGVWIQELDLEKEKLVGEPTQLTHGHATNARWTEGPHIYKIEDTYMLLVAEGGTGFHHAVSVFHSDNVLGPYVPYHANPVLTHRHLGKDYPIQATGHADLVRTQNGNWWAVMLGKRLKNDMMLLARETFMTPVEFQIEEGIPAPVFNPGHGKLLFEQKRPDLPWTAVEKPMIRDEFAGEELALIWNFLRTPYSKWYNLKDGKIEIELRPEVADSFVNPSLIARRIQHYNYSATTKIRFSSSKKNEHAGLILYRRSGHHYQLVKEMKELVLIRTSKGLREEIARADWKGDEVVLSARSDGKNLSFYYGPNINDLQQLGSGQALRILSDNEAGGFNGPYTGMYASSNQQKSNSTAEFLWFEYLPSE